MNETILIAEDEKRMRILISDFLNLENFNVLEAENGKKALELFNEKKDEIDLIILDVMMPIFDGWTVCKEIRKKSTIPVLMLTAKSEDTDELYGFELGVDEYISKPFKPNILVARVKALLRRKEKIENEIMNFNGLLIDEKAHKVSLNKEIIDFSPKEYDLLMYIIKNKGIALTREQILDGVWGYDYFGGLRTVDTHIKRVRIKLKQKENYIQTVRGLGYRFEVV
ncbi:response regulator transcription factor [Helicovermis profundi]|uniref:Stage 0 sporulation protein A homolog n=1 Tax=Helicovermis profundi TaxID=3065157 RepID=A0AAU9ETB2_9FIRM|nr:response regulator transcription factor [Clostridia bacterium S502]